MEGRGVSSLSDIQVGGVGPIIGHLGEGGGAGGLRGRGRGSRWGGYLPATSSTVGIIIKKIIKL